MVQQFPLRLVDSHMLAPSVRHLAFVRADGERLAFLPGQFLQIHFQHEGHSLRRSYSIASRADQPAGASGQIEMAVSYVDGGPATALLSALAVGEEVQASGPYGRFCLQEGDANGRYLLIATGTGVTPYRAMLPDIARRIAERGQRFVLLLGARRSEELLYGSEFEAFAAENPGFRYLACLSRGLPEAAAEWYRQGYVQTVLSEVTPDAEADIAYLCGNPDMVDACFGALKGAGLPIPHIRREKYISPKTPGGG